MKVLSLKRDHFTDESTIGRLTVGKNIYFTLEDTWRAHKIPGETRIPAGGYDLALRNEGRMTGRYKKRYPDMHRGMIWLRDVPNFTFVYLHVGNTHLDTDGCIIVGRNAGAGVVYSSRSAYEEIYPVVADAIVNGGCRIVIENERE
jgi:hypothetical protein